MLKSHPIGSVVTHRENPEFGYGIIVFSFPKLLEAMSEDINIDQGALAVVIWHCDNKEELAETPQIHPYSELKILNTQVGFA